MKRKFGKIAAGQAIILVASLAIWQLMGTFSGYVFFLVGTPTATWRELVRLIVYENLAYHFAVTGAEALLGLAIGTTIGSIAGLLLWYSDPLARMLRPFVLAAATLPIFAFAPLMIVWFGVGFSMKVALAALSTVFISFSQATQGTTLVSYEFVDVLKGMNASKRQIFTKVVIPSSLDWVLSSMRLNVGFGLLGAFIGEFIASDRGLGYLVLHAASLYNTPRAMAAAFGIILLALFFDLGASLIVRNRHLLAQFLSVPRSIWFVRS